jgi:carboxymethylenebutenolidase
MPTTTLELSTADGPMRTAIVRPDGDGPWPAVLFCMDGIGVRPTLLEMAARLAGHGYLVALPDLFHRSPPLDPERAWSMVRDPETRQQWRAHFFAPATRVASVRMDFGAVLAHLDSLPDVAKTGVGTTGYCMGGRISLVVAGCFGARVAAAASFHGGFLAADDPDSPHHLAPSMKAELFVAGSIEDPSFPDEMKHKLDATLTAAGVTHTIETWPARHGFAVADSPTHDPACAERHFATLLALYDRVLKNRS